LHGQGEIQIDLAPSRRSFPSLTPKGGRVGPPAGACGLPAGGPATWFFFPPGPSNPRAGPLPTKRGGPRRVPGLKAIFLGPAHRGPRPAPPGNKAGGRGGEKPRPFHPGSHIRGGLGPQTRPAPRRGATGGGRGVYPPDSRKKPVAARKTHGFPPRGGGGQCSARPGHLDPTPPGGGGQAGRFGAGAGIQGRFWGGPLVFFRGQAQRSCQGGRGECSSGKGPTHVVSLGPKCGWGEGVHWSAGVGPAGASLARGRFHGLPPRVGANGQGGGFPWPGWQRSR